MWPIHLGSDPPAPVVVVTIAAVADQSTLAAVSPTVTATKNGAAVTPTAWAWKVNGATTGITGPTTATPSYTPTTQGAKAITVDVTIDGIVYSSAPELFTVGPTAFSLALTAVADSNGLSTAALIATPTGAIGTVTYVWTLLGPDETSQTTLIADATAASTTAVLASIASGQRAGLWTAQCVATDAAGQAVTKTVQWQVGAKVAVNASLVWMYLHATIDFTAEATLSYLADDGAQVIGGYDFTSGNSAKADALGVVNGSGLRIVAKTSSDWVAGSRTAPFVDVALTELDSTWTTGTIFAVQTVYSWATAPAANDVGLRFFGCTETSTTISGEYMAWILDGYSGGSINTAINTVVDATGSSYTSLVGPSHALEIESFSGMVKFRRATSDPGSTVAAPGTWTAVAVSATADDDGPVAWQRRLGGVAPETDANCRVGWTIHRSATGNAADIYVERLYYWKAA